MTPIIRVHWAAARIACGVVALLMLAGCGRDDGPQRFALSGSVTFGGQPLPAGAIVFEPDTSRGNQGPGAVTSIRDGHYATEPGKGTVGGPHIARITGYDGKPAGGLKPLGNVLFGPREFPVNLPKANATHDFEIPPSK